MGRGVLDRRFWIFELRTVGTAGLEYSLQAAAVRRSLIHLRVSFARTARQPPFHGDKPAW